MRNLRLQIEYDGSGYAGWQAQNHRPRRAKTIQSEIEHALQRILKEKTRLIVSGRTDSGVHALGQVANFHTKNKIPADNLCRALNSILPKDISVQRAREVPLDFHSRFSAKSKVYRYLILNQDTPSAWLHGFVYFYPARLDFKKMRQGIKYLLGRHDFKAFCASGSSAQGTVRLIKRVGIKKLKAAPWQKTGSTSKADLFAIEIEAEGFLYNMARSIVGTLIEIGRGRRKPQVIRQIIASGDRRLVGFTAPARGLALVKVKY